MSLSNDDLAEMRAHAEDWLAHGQHHGTRAARNVLRLLDWIESAKPVLLLSGWHVFEGLNCEPEPDPGGP